MGTGALDNTDSITGLCPVILPAQKPAGREALAAASKPQCSPFDSRDLLKS